MESDDVKDEWDASSDEEVEAVKPVAPPVTKAAPKPQTKLQEKLTSLKLTEKLQQAKTVANSDLENFHELLGTSNPTSRQDLDALAMQLVAILQPLTTLPSFYAFADTVVRALVAPLDVDESRKIGLFLTSAINEKVKTVKESQGKGKKKGKKVSVNVMSRGVDTTNYDNDFDEMDFM